MKEIVQLPSLKPKEVEGRICIELKDAITGEVVQRVQGKNYVFEDSLFCGSAYDWSAAVSAAWLCLNDDDTVVDPDLPFLLGQTIGYGIPTTAGLTTMRGGYNAAYEDKAHSDLTKLFWKFKYEFTASQAIGTIKSLGLSRQYTTAALKHISCFAPQVFFTSDYTYSNDGRFQYKCSTAGIVTIQDLWLGTSSNIDVSAIVGTTSASIKTVGFDPSTGKFYIMVYSATTTLRKVYVFSNNTFATLETTYSPTNNSSGTAQAPFYIYNGIGYLINSASVHVIDFINNVAPVINAISLVNNAAIHNLSTCTIGTTNNSQTVCWSHYVLTWNNSTSKQGTIFDLATGCSWLGNVVGPVQYAPAGLHPRGVHKLPMIFISPLQTNCAISKYVLPTPITKTSSNSMTVTYDLEITY